MRNIRTLEKNKKISKITDFCLAVLSGASAFYIYILCSIHDPIGHQIALPQSIAGGDSRPHQTTGTTTLDFISESLSFRTFVSKIIAGGRLQQLFLFYQNQVFCLGLRHNKTFHYQSYPCCPCCPCCNCHRVYFRSILNRFVTHDWAKSLLKLSWRDIYATICVMYLG